MLTASDETETFDACKTELLASHPGQFALVCGRRLLGVCSSLEDALQQAAVAFDEGRLQDGAPILISEIAEPVRVRVIAEQLAKD